MHDTSSIRCDVTLSTRQTRPPSVLLIDDEIAPGDALLRLLALGGFHVECVPSGRAGLARGLGASWDALILDLHLPDMSAVELLDRLRRENVAYPIVAITGWYAGGDCEAVVRRLGATDFRRKPLDVEDLMCCLHRAIAAVRNQDTAAPGFEGTFGGTPSVTGTAVAGRCDLHWLHARARLGDDRAVEQLFESARLDLRRRLERRFRKTSPDLVEEAVVDALIDYVADPSRFDLRRDVPLLAFLRQAATRNLLNRLQSEHRLHRRQHAYATAAAVVPAELAPEDGLELWQALSADDVVENEEERKAFDLWRRGERGSEAFARALGLSGLSPRDQVQEVKRFKDRLIRRIRRLFARRRGAPSG